MTTPREPLATLRARFAGRAPTPAEWKALHADERAGVQQLVGQLKARAAREAAVEKAFEEKLRYERAHWSAGVVHVAGCDEAGMGPLAGPVVAGAVILKQDDLIRGIDDSKVLDEPERDRLAQEIRQRAVCWAVGIATAEEIDQINIRNAGILAMRRALEGLTTTPGHVLLDARLVPDLPAPQTPIIKGDALSLSIGAASILAKTHRDAMMVRYDGEHPGYRFAEHKGYGVPAHLDALRRLGACAIHRRSFAPVAEVLGLLPVQRPLL